MEDAKINEILQRMVADNVPEKNIIDYFSRKGVDINDWISKQEQNNGGGEQGGGEQGGGELGGGEQGGTAVQDTNSRNFDDVINSSGGDDTGAAALRNAIVNGKANYEVLKELMQDTKLANKLKDVTKKVIAKADKNLPSVLYGGKTGKLAFSELPKATQKALLKRAAGNFLMGAVTAAGTIYETGQNNKHALTRSDGNGFENGLYSFLDAVDNATEWAPVLSLVDLVGDAAGWATGTDDNGESYAQGGLLTKLVNIGENALGVDNGARTFWQNTPEQQLKDLEARDWMEDKGFKGKWGRTKKGLKAEKGSDAETYLKNDKAIDKIQGNTKGRGEKATDGESADLEQQHKRDANMYISWKNRSEGKKLDAKNAYTYNDFTKDFYQAEDGSWKKKKGGEDAGDLWRKMKKNSEKPEGETINL